METPNFLEKLASQFGASASVKNVYGEPIQAGDKTIIPVVQIAYGLGGGYGQGGNKGKLVPIGEDDKQNGSKGEGAGGGGGMYVKPKGIYEVTSKCTRFIPANNTKQVILGIAIGFMLKSLLHSDRLHKAK